MRRFNGRDREINMKTKEMKIFFDDFKIIEITYLCRIGVLFEDG
jgi:hypothetical protein